MNLKIKIHNIKHINDIEFNMNLEKGLYAITGENGSGKSTIVTCASSSFFNMQMNEYIGKTVEDARIDFEISTGTCSYFKENGRWKRKFSGDFKLNGFYEGSLIFGNRFRNTSFDKLKKLEKIKSAFLQEAPPFIKENLGQILHGDSTFYDKLFVLTRKKSIFNGDIFFYEKNNIRVNQFHMSTGENLLISILDSINRKNTSRIDREITSLILLDEIELALHPAALRRLMNFLRKIADEYNYAIYFSTHSIELISAICPSNIYFIERYSDNTLEILNPCFPAYATRILYEHDGYDRVIMVEDDLSKEIIKRVLKKEHLLEGRLVHILPCGGYSNVISLAHEVLRDNLLSKKTSLSIVLDGDITEEVNSFISKKGIGRNLPLSYLPLKSLEKYLRANLFSKVDHKLFRILNDYLFQQVSLKEILNEYARINKRHNDSDGKQLFRLISEELEKRNKSRQELIEIILDYIFEENPDVIKKIIRFFRTQLS
ncbi:MAG: AAA family ATPase [Muribaculaceae bacterium]|nr:AAA family ATPase [Muribaculaceae bacterium]